MHEKEIVIGSWVNTASPIVAELMAACGFDFLTVDAEHSAIGLPEVQSLFQAVRSGNPDCAPFVRTPSHDYRDVKRYADAGAIGIICPLVNTAKQAAEVVSAVKYPPQGARGVGFCRDNLYGMRLSERVADANDETIVCVQIEHSEAVKNIDEILAVEGVDVAFIGPYDLSASMGITAQFDHPDYIAAKGQILEACMKHDVVAGIHVVQPNADEVAKACEEGYRFVAYSLDITMLMDACTRGLSDIRRQIDG
jgi:2-dehydro-3-deoxyglucarate aldolase